MSSTFMTAPSLLFTSESVTEGHPDKMCDQISDAVVDAIMAQDPHARIACETAVKTGFVILLGEITTTATLNYDELVRAVVKDIGFDDSAKGLTAKPAASKSPSLRSRPTSPWEWTGPRNSNLIQWTVKRMRSNRSAPATRA